MYKRFNTIYNSKFINVWYSCVTNKEYFDEIYPNKPLNMTKRWSRPYRRYLKNKRKELSYADN